MRLRGSTRWIDILSSDGSFTWSCGSFLFSFSLSMQLIHFILSPFIPHHSLGIPPVSRGITRLVIPCTSTTTLLHVISPIILPAIFAVDQKISCHLDRQIPQTTTWIRVLMTLTFFFLHPSPVFVLHFSLSYTFVCLYGLGRTSKVLCIYLMTDYDSAPY